MGKANFKLKIWKDSEAVYKEKGDDINKIIGNTRKFLKKKIL